MKRILPLVIFLFKAKFSQNIMPFIVPEGQDLKAKLHHGCFILWMCEAPMWKRYRMKPTACNLLAEAEHCGTREPWKTRCSLAGRDQYSTPSCLSGIASL